MSCSSSSDEEFGEDMEELLSAVSSKFVIVSKLNGKVLDITKNKMAAGAKVIMYDRKSEKNANQLWYLDSNGFIKAAMNGMTMYADKEGEPLRTSTRNDPKSNWKIDGEKIVNGLGQCLDIRGASRFNKAELCAYRWKGNDNQKWKIEHVG